MIGYGLFCAVASFIVPGLGQLLQGRPILAIAFFCLCCGLWPLGFGWLIHIGAGLEAAHHEIG